MNKIGIRAHDVGRFHADELADRVRQLGFDGIQLVFKKALIDEVDFNHLEGLKKAFIKPSIMMLGAYFNPYHPNQNEVIKGIDTFKKHLEIAHELGCQYIGTETGSWMGSPWGYHPLNHRDLALDTITKTFQELASYAEKHDAYLTLEGAYHHVCYSPQRLAILKERLHSPAVKITIDLFNYLNIENHLHHVSILDESIRLFKDDIVIFHLKDYVVKDHKLVQVGLGQGLMNYPMIIHTIKKHCPDAFLIFEGVTGDDILSSYDYITTLLKGDLS